MNMEGNKGNIPEIDIAGIVTLLWNNRKRIIVNCFWAGILAIVIAFSIPKEYTSSVTLAPEISSGMSGFGGSLGTLASMAGVDLNVSGSDDALYPELYPQIVSSTPFLSELMEMPVEGVFRKEQISTDLYHYLRYYQREAWWEKILGTPGRLMNRIHSNPADTVVPTVSTDSRNLTRRQQTLMKSLDKRISVSVDKGTNVIDLGVTMQDPGISADVAQAVSDKLQEHIANYRSAKARKDLQYTEQLYKEAQQKYHEAQQKYASFSDQHQGLVRMQYQIEQDRLSNEQDLAFNVYNQIATQYEMAKAKVQEQTPVCVIMQPPVVPFKASSPKKMMMGVLFVMMAFLGTSVWLILKNRVFV